MTTVDPSEPRWETPLEMAEFMGTLGAYERDAPLDLDGAHANMLCDGIAELLEENKALKSELEAIRAEDWHIKLIHELRQEIAKHKPSWDDAPDGANYYAIDEDSFPMWFSSKPEPKENEWFDGSKHGEWEGANPTWYVNLHHWRETLERRPGSESDD